MPTLTTPHFRVVHMPKTAGTYITAVLRALDLVVSVEGEDGADAHRRACEMPRDLPLVGSLRDPWSWYASIAAYWRGAGPTGRAWLQPYAKAAAREGCSIMAAMAFPVALGVQPTGKRPPPEETLRGAGRSLYAWNVIRAFCDADAQALGTNEIDARFADHFLLDAVLDGARPLAALRALLNDFEVRCPRSAWRRAAAVPRMLESGWSHRVADVYDDVTLRRIGRRDGWIARRFGMDRPGPARGLVWRAEARGFRRVA